MTLVELAPPIAAATTVNAFLFALMWRGGQIEKLRGDPPWWLILGLLAYIAALSGFAYVRNDSQLAGWIDVFGAAMIGEAAGGILVFGILNTAFFSRGMPMRERITAGVFTAVFAAAVFAGLFAS